MTPRIFVGGTGRSGTTILYKLLRSHPFIHAFRTELRFITDDSGLLPLIDALSTNYTQVRARESLHRFERLMTYDLKTPDRTPYKKYNLNGILGFDCSQEVDDLLKKLTVGRFEGEVGQRNYEEMYYWDGNYSRLRKKKTYRRDYEKKSNLIGRYFENRDELEGIVSKFLDKLFLHSASLQGKKIWCEKTPANMNNLPSLHRLFPDALFVHIKRDPRAVATSFSQQQWAPSNIGLSCQMLKQILAKWRVVKENMAKDVSYLEIKLEELTSDPVSIMEQVALAIGTSNDFPAAHELDKGISSAWQSKINSSDMDILNKELEHEIRYMGYEV